MSMRDRKRRMRSLYGDIISIGFLLLVAAFMILPLIYSVSNAFKPLDELFLFPPTFFVRKPTMQNFLNFGVMMSNSWVPFSRYLFNSLFITAVGTGGHVILSTMAAYVLAKRQFPGRNIFFAVVVASLMFAPQVTSIPNYLVMGGLKWIDTFWSVVVPAWGYSLGLFLMKQFIEQMIPDAVIEAAQCDGASELRIVFSIVTPMVKPAWLTLIVFSVQSLWNASGSLFLLSEAKKTLPYAMSQIMQGGIARVGVAAAVAVIMMIVPIGTFMLTQSNIVETMSTSGIKD